MPDESEHVHKHIDEPYGYMERELAFKLLASHALVDAEFFAALKDHPRDAAADLHIHLDDEDVDYIKNHVVWADLEPYADDIRIALRLDLVTNSW